MYADACRIKERLERLEMLAGENICRDHQSALFACSADSHNGEHGDDGLSAAHVALQQCVELLFAIETVNDCIQRRVLTCGQLEREARFRGHHVPQINLAFMSANLLIFAALHHAQAKRQKLQNLEFALRLVNGIKIFRHVERTEVVHHGCKMQIVRELARARVRECESRKVENRFVQIAEEPLFHLGFAAYFAYRVDGENLSVKRFAFVERLHVRMHQLQPAVRTDRPRNKPTRPWFYTVCNESRASEK